LPPDWPHSAAVQLALILGLAFIESLVLFTLVIIFVKVV
jgi:F0F1-type ATP synthase membrane subunit c/vacuolar-type H+-ATPase subunit K